MLSTNHLSVGYKKKIIIHDIDLTVQPGEIITLIGPNGAGKSTILKTISRQLAPICGVVRMENQPLSDYTPDALAKRMSILMTERLKTELMSCREVVEAGRYPYTGRLGLLSEHDKKIVSDSMEITHTESLADEDFNTLSDGQKQRILLAKAICQEPDLLILDEPTSYLDIHYKLELLEILKSLVHERKIAILMSLHELELAQKISDRILCIDGEQIDRTGTPEEIFKEDYLSSLYHVDVACLNTLYGSVELPRIAGEPAVFVIGGGGTGIPVYRRLQRMRIPFAAGILFENDLDYPVARSLASKIITVPAFGEIDDNTLQSALSLMDCCQYVLCCNENFTGWNEKNRLLFQHGKGKLVKKAEEVMFPFNVAWL